MSLKKFKLQVRFKKMLADTVTPVSIYLKLRDKFPNSILLESSDYHGHENSMSFICCKPIASFKIENEKITELFPDGSKHVTEITPSISVPDALTQFAGRFEPGKSDLKFISSGLFGFMTYDSVRYFENIRLDLPSQNIPDSYYSVYRYVIALDHFKNELYIIDNNAGVDDGSDSLEHIENLISSKSFASYHFKITGREESNFTDSEFMKIVGKGKEHCQRGDVFQIVLSRKFSQPFSGDEFNVYRALRSINPSPYLFYFDYGNFRLFGSSPEAQIVIKNGTASIHPIAGTFLRTGDDMADKALAEKLLSDPKENSEHTMLVDLARNDLSRNCSDVKVDTYREVQYYSHVIHLVSKVTGKLNEGVPSMKIVADTFPAGTLSGAPKHMAMKLINSYEKANRGFYGGCIGFMGFNGDFNHAIMIRSFMSKDTVLHYQAGAGVVVNSSDESEKNEVNNKLMALKNAMQLASSI